MQNIGQSVLRNLWLAIPPVHEQQAIIAHVASEVRPVTEAIARLEREIELIHEYRTRLVADVVTGQLDVREAALHLPADAPPDLDVEPGDEVDDTEFNDEEVAEA